MDRYEPMSPNRKTVKLLRKSRKVNDDRDRIERRYRSAPPSECPLDVHLRTVLTALFVGIEQQDWAIVGEATCMLQDAELRTRQEGCEDENSK